MKKAKKILFKIVNFNKKFIKKIPHNKKCCVIIFHDYEREYANRKLGKNADKGLKFILETEKKYGIKATYNIVGKICESHPESVLRIKKQGHEIASHTYLHEIPRDLSYKELEESIRKSKAAFEKLGIKIIGFRSPRSRWNYSLIKILEKENFEWDAESDDARHTYYIKNKLLRIPIKFDDWDYRSNNLKPDKMFIKLRKIIEEGIKNKEYVAIGFHPWVQGLNKERLKVFEEFIIYLTNQKDVICLTFGEVANFCRSLD